MIQGSLKLIILMNFYGIKEVIIFNYIHIFKLHNDFKGLKMCVI